MNLTGWIRNFLQSPAWLKQCRQINNTIQKENDDLRKKITDLNDDSQNKFKTIAGLKAKVEGLEGQLKPEPMEEYYADKYPKADIDYIVHATDGNYNIDVRNFFQYHDYKLPTVTGSNDEKALKALLWVMENVKYVHDKEAYGFDEYWAFPWQTLKRKVGDCEDGMILILNILAK